MIFYFLLILLIWPVILISNPLFCGKGIPGGWGCPAKDTELESDPGFFFFKNPFSIPLKEVLWPLE